METLSAIASRHKTDKVTHGYCERYELYLSPMRKTVERVLEIGIAGGASLRMWRDYFPAVKTVLGVDHNKESCEGVAADEGITPLFGDATKAETWKQIKDGWGNNFDLIVDDGYHTTANIIQTFQLAFPLVGAGKLYAIEDLHASYLSDYNRDNALVGLRADDNAVGWLKAFVDDVNERGNGQSGIQTFSSIESVHFHKSLVIIRKR